MTEDEFYALACGFARKASHGILAHGLALDGKSSRYVVHYYLCAGKKPASVGLGN